MNTKSVTAVREIALATKHSFNQAFVNTGRSVAAHSSTAVAKVDAAKAAVPSTVVSAGASFFKGVAVNMAILEAVDVVYDLRAARLRRHEIEELTLSILREGETEEKQDRLKVLRRAPERRTFGQFIRDLPSRTMRRVWRGVLVETGWWYTFFTSPIWAPVAVAYAAYAWLIVFPSTVVASVWFNHDLHMGRWLDRPSRVVQAINKVSLYAGVNLMRRGIRMRVHNRSAYCSTEAYEIIEAAKLKAHEDVAKIVDGRTAFAWGEQVAEAINGTGVNVADKQRAYAQFTYWADESIAAPFLKGVKHGFRTGTPMLYRDLVVI